MLRLTQGTVACLLWLVLGAGVGCHASPDDPAGQARELSDPVRRRNAIENIRRLYASALDAAEGDRSKPSVVALADATVEALTKAYIEYPDDVGAGEDMLAVLEEMRDPRSLPAVKKALSWRAATQAHAVRAAKIVRWVQVPAADTRAVADALGAALGKVRQSRPQDVRLRREAILALGSLADPVAHPHLIKVMERQSEDQDFLFNRLAARQLARTVTGAESVPVLIRALFQFDAQHPNRQLEDVARSGLVRLGSDAVGPLLAVFSGDDAEAKEAAGAYVAALRAAGISGYSAERLMKERAAATLGEIGDPRAFEPLAAAARNGDVEAPIRWEAACALVKFKVPPARQNAVRSILTTVYEAGPLEHKPRLIGAMRRSFDAGFLPFLLTQVRDREIHPDIRILAAGAYAQLANKGEAAALRQVIAAEPSVEDGGFRTKFAENDPLLALADACDADQACWLGKVNGASDANAVIKAATMLGRYGRGEPTVVAALVSKLTFPKLDVRVAVLQALDRVAVNGSDEAIAVLDKLGDDEEGTSIGKKFAPYALPTRARLAARGG